MTNQQKNVQTMKNKFLLNDLIGKHVSLAVSYVSKQIPNVEVDERINITFNLTVVVMITTIVFF